MVMAFRSEERKEFRQRARCIRSGDRDIPAPIPLLYMNLRVLEVLVALGCLALFIVLLVMLPAMMAGMEGLAYIAALVAFIAALSTAGYMIDKKAA